MEPLGENIWATSFELTRPDEAFIDVWPAPLDEATRMGWHSRPVYRGSRAPMAVARAEVPEARLISILVPAGTLDHERPVFVYLPEPDESRVDWPVIYMADGGNAMDYGPIAEALARTCQAQPVILVGIGNQIPGEGQNGSDLRAADYLWGRNPDRFAAHERFLLEDVIPLAEGSFGASSEAGRRMLSGSSNGAGWAVAMGLRHPDLFGSVAAASFGWPDALEAAEDMPAGVNFFISAGIYEPRIQTRSLEAADRIRTAGGQAQFIGYVTGHSPLAFYQLFAHALRTHFPAEADCTPRPLD